MQVYFCLLFSIINKLNPRELSLRVRAIPLIQMGQPKKRTNTFIQKAHFTRRFFNRKKIFGLAGSQKRRPYPLHFINQLVVVFSLSNIYFYYIKNCRLEINCLKPFKGIILSLKQYICGIKYRPFNCLKLSANMATITRKV